MATIKIENPIGSIGSIGRDYNLYFTIQLEENETINGVATSRNIDWVTISNINRFSCIVKIQENTALTNRSGFVYIIVTTSKGTYQAQTAIVQSGVVYTPIYVDTIEEIETDSNFVNYTIKNESDEIIFSGKSYVMPNTNIAKINVSEICLNYMNSEPTGSERMFIIRNDNAMQRFYLYVNTELYNSYNFYNCYFPNEQVKIINESGNTFYNVSVPIKKEIDVRQTVVMSFIALNQNNNSVNCEIKYKDNTIENLEFTLFSNPSQYTFYFDEDYTNIESIKMLGNEYKVVDTCSRYCLYYVNAFGGWDSFLINGNDKKVDNIESHTYTKKVPIQQNVQPNAIRKYMNNIKTKYTLYTGWLNDEEASKMYNLLESTRVVLFDMEEHKLIPVIIKNTTCEYKTFTNNGKKKFYYTIELEEANIKFRK